MSVPFKRLLLTLFCVVGVVLTLVQAVACAEVVDGAAVSVAIMDSPEGPDDDLSLTAADVDDSEEDLGILSASLPVSIPAARGGRILAVLPPTPVYLSPDLRPPIAA